nr:MAG TPA: hypothetical protein [Bacteriophage sp.]
MKSMLLISLVQVMDYIIEVVGETTNNLGVSLLIRRT